MWGSGYSSKASVWDCYAKHGEISLLLCLFRKEHPGKWKMQAHNERFVKTRLEAGSSVSYCKFLADIQLLLLFCSQAHLSVWCHQIQWGREPEQIGTDSVLQPASLSAHVVTIQRVSRNQMCLKDSQTVRSPKGNYGEVPVEKVCVCVIILQSQFWPTHLLCSLLNLGKVRLGNASELTAKSAGHGVTMVTCQ